MTENTSTIKYSHTTKYESREPSDGQRNIPATHCHSGLATHYHSGLATHYHSGLATHCHSGLDPESSNFILRRSRRISTNKSRSTNHACPSYRENYRTLCNQIPNRPTNYYVTCLKTAQNKPNLPDSKMNVSAVITDRYENAHPSMSTQNKPNSNPISHGVASGEAGSNPNKGLTIKQSFLLIATGET